ncbi:hypothetical protein KXZ74_26055, partial [Escherichia coli]|nr:hypothetical protein [Escherichia coli]
YAEDFAEMSLIEGVAACAVARCGSLKSTPRAQQLEYAEDFAEMSLIEGVAACAVARCGSLKSTPRAQ